MAFLGLGTENDRHFSAVGSPSLLPATYNTTLGKEWGEGEPGVSLLCQWLHTELMIQMI